MSFENEQKDRLRERTGKLIELLNESAPKPLIASEVGLIIEAGIGYCGPDVLTSVAESMTRWLRFRHSFCEYCENKLPGLPGSFNDIVVCPDCRIKLDKEITEAVKEITEAVVEAGIIDMFGKLQ